MALPTGWRRLTESEKREVRRMYAAALAAGISTKAARDLYRALRGKTRSEILDILKEAASEYEAAAAKRLAAATKQAKERAHKAAATSIARRLTDTGAIPTGTLGERAARWLQRRIASPLESYRVSPLVGRRTAVVHPGGEVWLSRRLHGGNTSQVVQGLRRALVEGARHGETASALAQRLRDDIGHGVRIDVPKRLRALEREAYQVIKASGDPRAAQTFAPIRDDFRRYAESLRQTTRGTQAAAMDVLAKVERAVARCDAVGVEHAVKWWTWNLEQSHQQMIAETETTRAFSKAYVEAGKENPFVVAWEWEADADACDECAALDGKVMTESELVYPPAHPHCRCLLLEVTDTTVEISDERWDQILAGDAA